MSIEMSNEKASNFFTKLLSGLRRTKKVEKDEKVETMQSRRLQLLQLAVEEDEYETLDTFFELIQRKQYNQDDDSSSRKRA